MNHGIQGPSPPVNPPGLALGRQDAGVLATVLSFMGPGVTFDQAVQDAIDAGAIDPADLQRGDLEGEVAGLDSHQRQQLARHPDSIPPTVRHELEHLGVLQPQADARPAQPQSETGRTAAGDRPPGAAFQGRGEALLAFGGATRSEAAIARSATPARAEAAATTPSAGASAVVQPGGGTQPGAVAAVPASSDAWLARIGIAAIGAGRTDSPAIASAQERTSSTVNQATLNPQQAVPAAQARTTDALAVQVLPQGAALATAASPQGTVVVPQVQAPLPGGTTAAIGGNQQRPERQAPAGHTQAASAASAASARRNGREGAAGRDTGRPGSMLDMLTARRRRDDDESSPFQWLFWILTLVAYGALAIAAFALVSGSNGLVDAEGRPGYGAYALAIGALGALGSWFAGRRLARRARHRR